MKNITVIGHTSPDTDATCSPIAYAWYLSEKKGQKATAYVSGSLNNETTFILKRFGVEAPEVLSVFKKDMSVVLVDTNNPDELLDGIHDAELIEIVDHHKLVGGLSTRNPIPVRIEPLACSATIVWKIMKENNATELPKNIAGIMLSAILSDTLKFTSPTTTDEDKHAAEELAKLCGEDIDKLSEDMFAAKSDLTGLSADDILTADSKTFDFGGKKGRISVLETTSPQNALDMMKDVKEGMVGLMKKEGLDHMFFFVVDILKTESTLMVASDEDKALAEKAFSATFNGDTLHLPGVVSRKKQMVPVLESVITG